MRAFVAAVAVALTASLVPAGTAAASEPVHIEVALSFDEGTQTFESNLDGCETGMVTDRTSLLWGSARFGIFNGFKDFSCDSGGEFTIRLQAKFGDFGSIGSWAFVGGTYAGNGTLAGVPFDVGNGITDTYHGTLRP